MQSGCGGCVGGYLREYFLPVTAVLKKIKNRKNDKKCLTNDWGRDIISELSDERDVTGRAAKQKNLKKEQKSS